MLQKEVIRIKLKLIFIPFVAVSISFIFLYTLANYLFYQSGIVKLDITLISTWLPLSLSWIPVLIWIRPTINLLCLKQKDGKDLDMLYYLVAWATMGIPTVIAQEYLQDTTGKLTRLSSISQIDEVPISKFYTLEEYWIDKEHVVIRHHSSVTGRHNDNLNFIIFVACPILAKKGIHTVSGSLPKYRSDSSSFYNKHHSWLCLQYSERVSTRLSLEKKKQLYNEFINNSSEEFARTDLASFHYLKQVAPGSDREYYNEAVANSSYENTAAPHLLFPVHKTFDARGEQKLQWILKSFFIAASVFAVMLLSPKLNTAKLRLHNKKTN